MTTDAAQEVILQRYTLTVSRLGEPRRLKHPAPVPVQPLEDAEKTPYALQLPEVLLAVEPKGALRRNANTCASTTPFLDGTSEPQKANPPKGAHTHKA